MMSKEAIASLRECDQCPWMLPGGDCRQWDCPNRGAAHVNVAKHQREKTYEEEDDEDQPDEG